MVRLILYVHFSWDWIFFIFHNTIFYGYPYVSEDSNQQSSTNNSTSSNDGIINYNSNTSSNQHTGCSSSKDGQNPNGTTSDRITRYGKNSNCSNSNNSNNHKQSNNNNNSAAAPALNCSSSFSSSQVSCRINFLSAADFSKIWKYFFFNT